MGGVGRAGVGARCGESGKWVGRSGIVAQDGLRNAGRCDVRGLFGRGCDSV